MVKLKLIRVTNMSVSSRISCTDGGGRAMANATIPSSGGFAFLVCENVYCVRSRHNINTTCVIATNTERNFYFNGPKWWAFSDVFGWKEFVWAKTDIHWLKNYRYAASHRDISHNSLFSHLKLRREKNSNTTGSVLAYSKVILILCLN